MDCGCAAAARGQSDGARAGRVFGDGARGDGVRVRRGGMGHGGEGWGGGGHGSAGWRGGQGAGFPEQEELFELVEDAGEGGGDQGVQAGGQPAPGRRPGGGNSQAGDRVAEGG